MAISLKAARVNVNLTQDEAAKSIGVSKDTIRNWEQGKCFPAVDMLEALLKLYNVSYDDLIFFTLRKRPQTCKRTCGSHIQCKERG